VQIVLPLLLQHVLQSTCQQVVPAAQAGGANTSAAVASPKTTVATNNPTNLTDLFML